MHACQIGPTDTAPPCLGSPHQGCIMTRGKRFEAGNLSAPISPLLLKCMDGASTLSLFRILDLSGKLAARCLQSRPAQIIFCFCCWVADGKEGGMARSDIEWWVAAAMGRICRSHAISILRRIVRATKAATWSHPSALFSIVRAKPSSVRGCSPISYRMSSHPPGAVEMPDTQTECARHHHFAILSQLEQSGLSTSFMWKR